MLDENGNLDRKKLEEGRKVLKNLQTDQDKQSTDSILLECDKAWNKHREINPDTVKISDEYNGLSKEGKQKLFDKINHENREVRSMGTQERSVRNAEEREKQHDYDKRYYEISSPDKLANMTEDEIKAERTNVGDKDYKQLYKDWQKVQTDEGKNIYKVRTDKIDNVLKSANITDVDQKAQARRAVAAWVDPKEINPKKIEEQATQAVQHLWKTEHHMFGRKDTQEIKTPEEMKKEKETTPVKDKFGRVIGETYKGYKYIGNDQWQK